MQISYRQEVYRKLIHLSSLWMVAAMYFLPVFYSSGIFLLLFLGNVLAEYGYYRKWPVIYQIYDLFFSSMLRKSKGDGKFELSGSPWVLASAFLTVLLFNAPIAVFAFSTMLVGDTAAALVGRKFGRFRFPNGKSLEGLAAFVLAGLVVLLICGIMFDFSGLYTRAIVAVFMASLAEFYGKTIRLDDNFSVPLIIGIVMALGGCIA